MNKKGFTLVELLAVIAILALLVIIALPNVLEMFNKAKKELFLTEVKTIYKEVSKKYISENMKGNKIDSITNNKNRLNIESNDIKYKIDLDDKGNIKSLVVSNKTYCIKSKNVKLEDLTVDMISDDCSTDNFKEVAGTLKKSFFEVSGMTDRSAVSSISFYSDNRTIDGAEMHDVSENQDGSIKMYIKPNSESSSLYDISIVADGIISFPKDSSSLFGFYHHIACGPAGIYITNLKEINFNDSITTDEVTNMSNMFTGNDTETLDLSNFNTSNVTDMGFMFKNNRSKTLDLSNFDTSKVTTMSHMFAYSGAEVLDLSSFDTNKVTNMVSMFEGSSATKINLSSFNTSNVTNMSNMFDRSDVVSLDLTNFDTSKVTNMMSMFSYSKLQSINISSFDTSSAIYMNGMFNYCPATEIIGLTNFDTKNVINMSRMFESTKLAIIDLSSFNTNNVTNMSGMFAVSDATTIIGIDKFNTSKVTNMSRMFSSVKFDELNLSSFDTSNVTETYYMFYNSTNLKTIYATDKFNVNKVYDSSRMFYNCKKLKGGSGTTYNSSKVDKTYARLDGGTSSPGYFSQRK